MDKRQIIGRTVVTGMVALLAATVEAANLRVTNVTIAAGAPAGEMNVTFDIQWDGSWRTSWVEDGNTWTNWDAAWIFVKFREEGGASWSHATLSTNASDHAAPGGSTIDVGLTGTYGMGVFLYRSAEGRGSPGPWVNRNVRLRWKCGQDGVASTAKVDVAVHAIEMVFVPQGAYDLGDGDGSAESTFAFHVTDNTKVRINADLVSNITVDVNAQDDDGMEVTRIGIDGDDGLDTDNDGSVDNIGFPTGYKAFYCMKYEISQGQYAEFLNRLPAANASSRYPGSQPSEYRYTIGGTHPEHVAAAPDRACNYLSWQDGMAYADWSGLRPMTELEYEKACRGPVAAVNGEFAWGDATIVGVTGFTGTDGSGTETPSGATMNSWYRLWAPAPLNEILGPARCGLCTRPDATRATAGATYWGIMDMSGNLNEWVVTVGKSQGRAFTGGNGDGVLNAGVANVSGWPVSNGATCNGLGRRGQVSFTNESTRLRVSDRNETAYDGDGRGNWTGFRAVRAAP